MALTRRCVSADGSNTSLETLPTCKLADRFPTLVEFLTSLKYSDGSARQTGTITLMRDADTFKAALHDREVALSSFVSGKTFTALLEALEKGLAADTLEWREKKEWTPAKGGKKP